MEYYVTDRTGKVHKFTQWQDAIKFAIRQAKLKPRTPVYMQWGEEGYFKYQVWEDGVINRLESYCACDTCPCCGSPDGSTTCPHYWELSRWEYYDTHEG